MGSAVAWQVALDKLAGLKGNPEAVYRAVDAWRGAANLIAMSMESIETSYTALGAHWEGPAYDNFKEYMGKNQDKSKDNRDALLEVGIQLAEAAGVLQTSYINAVAAAREASIQIGPLIVQYRNAQQYADQVTMTEAMTQVLQNFASGINNIHAGSKTAITEYKTYIAKIQGTASKLQKPVSPPGGLGNRAGWEAK
ncbi:WXG100 family type VII secretion target [Actinomadura rugatobispora]|uniref:WXG100 family type VII secretion target n=1 Tax=Actinomadura rugatobispora TaxID=1994 RepID=A0ABW1ABI8_9ACTN